MFYFTANCANGQYFNRENLACEPCAIGYRDAGNEAHDQMKGCKACTDIDDLCPDEDKTGCRARAAGEVMI